MSIYQTISGALNGEGRLPRDFELPRREPPPNEIRWMVGAKDGAFSHHASSQKQEEVIAEMIGFLKAGKPRKIPAVLRKHSVIDLIDPLLSAIRENTNVIDAEMVCDYAAALAFEGDDE